MTQATQQDMVVSDELADLLEQLDRGVPALGLHEDNSTELFDIDAANDTMAEAAKTLRTATPAPEWQGMAKAPEAIIRDLVLWINTNAKHLPEGKKLGIQDYMKRMGIQGSPFRAALPFAPIKDAAK
jgi:hypothetical protein